MRLKINVGISQHYGGLEITLMRSDAEHSKRVKKDLVFKGGFERTFGYIFNTLPQQNQNLQHLLDAIEREEDVVSMMNPIAFNKQVVCCVHQNTPILKIQNIQNGAVQDGQTICVNSGPLNWDLMFKPPCSV